MNPWWKYTVFYEIYMTSFCDGNGDGAGDIPGIISKLPYLKKLGVGGIWLTPFYPSPKVDNGYDISEYCDVAPEYGTMGDFEQLLEQAHKLGIRVIADMVVNHTSTSHKWFVEASSSEDSPKRDWYIWKDSKKGLPPNNWESFFGGSAWEYDETSGQYYYHSFAREQADLNWTNPKVEEAVGEILDYWLEKGIDGFRFDVINNLSVTQTMQDNPVEHGKQLHKNDVNQPGIHSAIARICKRVRKKRPDVFLVGEISSEVLTCIHSYVGMGGLDTTFNFNLGSRKEFHFGELLEELKQMQTLYGSGKMPTLFFGSHDMRRFPDRFTFPEGKVKCLLMLMLVCRGIPFLYFGDELGMRSRILSSVEEAKDIQGILAYKEAVKEGMREEEALRILNDMSRDASRNPMDWEEAERQMNDPHSVFHAARHIMNIRNQSEILANGAMTLREPVPEMLEIERSLGRRTITAFLNFSDGKAAAAVKPGHSLLLASEEAIEREWEDHIWLPPGSCVMLGHLE